jgi:signal transduction histidine kinase
MNIHSKWLFIMRLNYAQLAGVAVLFGYIILSIIIIALPVNGLFIRADLLLALNIVFQSGTLFVVAFISANSYLKSGLPQLLLIGSGMISLTTAVLIHSLSPLFITNADYADFTVSIHNTGLLIFAIFMFLASITGDLYLAKLDLASLPNNPEKENLNQTLTAIEENINYISKIVADLQDYARTPNPYFQQTDLKQVIDTILIKNNTPNNINIITNISEEAKTLTTDTIYLQRIINNLITNAIYAMPDGGTLTIQATKNTQTNKIILTIKDTGIGIPKDIQTKIFNPLFTTRSKGQGLGLSVVKRFTEALDGTISFESQEGKGTTFNITLPTEKTKIT